MADYYIAHSDAVNAIVSQAAAGDGVEQYNIGVRRAASAVDLIPAADVVEVKRGKWFHYEGTIICSECKASYYDDIMEYTGDVVPKYCLNCGARMEG